MYGMFTYTFGLMFGFHVGKYTSPMDIYIYINFYCSHQHVMALPPVFSTRLPTECTTGVNCIVVLLGKQLWNICKKAGWTKLLSKKKNICKVAIPRFCWLQIHVSFWICYVDSKIWATNKWRKKWQKNQPPTNVDLLRVAFWWAGFVFSNWQNMGKKKMWKLSFNTCRFF